MYKALIVDDEKPVRTVISHIGKWNSLGIAPPFTANNGSEGLLCMREIRPDIVFVDMQMPIMNGIEFLSLASIEFPFAKFVVISGFDDFHYAQSAIKHGAIDYLLKPIVREELEKALEKAVNLLNSERNVTLKEIDDKSDNPDQIIEMIKDYIEKNYSENINISMFSDKFYFSKEYLSKLFKKKYGVGIYEYSINLKMKRAKDLLMDSEISIKEVSERLGYSNSNYFSKAFKHHYNRSPREFRDDEC